MPRFPKFAFACLACAGLMTATGCHARHEEDRVQGKMFYRASPKPSPQANTMSVGRYGHNADYGRWNESGTGDSGAGYETSASVGRQGTTAQSSTGFATGVGGDPIDNAGVSSTYSDKGGSNMGVSGDGASSSEYGEGSTRYGTESP